MIHLLINKLPCCNSNDITWKHIDNTLYDKHTQHVTEQPIAKVGIPENIQEAVTQVTTVTPVTTVTQVTRVKETYMVDVTTDKTKKKANDKATVIKPLDIILSESCTFDSSLDNIKQKLIDFISKKEFSKVFGMTKSADIMSGIVNNRWNKSTALFISFLFDKSVNYNSSIVLYNSEKNNGVIATTV